MGALTAEAANEPDRPPAEREALLRQSRQSFQKAIDVDPKFAAAYVALGESYLTTGEREQAEAMFKKATDLAPDNAALWSELGAAQARAKDWPSAVGSLNRAVQIDPGNKPLETRLGLTLARAGRYEDALNILAKVMPEAEARYNVARMMRHNQENAAADVQLQLALKADPAFEAAREMMGGAATHGVQQASYLQTAAAPDAAMRLPPVQLGSGAGQ
jgi:tetratricopeptide (TPR) repeat protein